ncbi:MAG: FtsX-like permease family protein [Thermodesulfobacteriota bacterium]
MNGFLPLSITNLRRHTTRSLLTMLGIAASVGVFFAVFSLNRGFERGLARELEGTGLHFMVVPSGCAHEVASLVLHGAVIPKYLDTRVMAHIEKIDGIALATPILVAQLPNPAHSRVDLIYGVEMAALSAIKPSWQIKGRMPAADDEVLLGAEVAGHMKLNAGDTLTYAGAARPLRVAGVVQKTGSQDDAFVYLPLATARKLLDKPGGATAIGVKVREPEKISTITTALEEKAPGIQIVTMGQVMNSIANLAASARSLSISIACIAVLISAVGVMNAILMAVFERTQEIGMMRAIGASRGDVFRMILTETTLLTVSGGLAGIVMAMGGAPLIEAFVRTILPYMPSGEMVTFDPLLAAASLLFALAIGLLAGLFPAWKASTINPIEAIKG